MSSMYNYINVIIKKKLIIFLILVFSLFFYLVSNTNAEEIKYKTYKIGDEVEVSGEPFYVISQTEDKVTLFAKYNLNCGDRIYPDGEKGIQNENVRAWRTDGKTTYGDVPFFESSPYWSRMSGSYPKFVYGEESSVYQYLESYKSYLESKTDLEIYEVTLLSAEQALKLGCSLNGKGDCNYDWMYNTTYWLGSAMNNNYLYYISTNQRMYFANDVSGIRPVVTVSKERNIYDDGVISNPSTLDNIQSYAMGLFFSLNAIIIASSLRKKLFNFI